MTYRSTRSVFVGGVKIFVGDTLKIIDGRLWLMNSKKPYVFALDPKKGFPYGNWKKMLEKVDEPAESDKSSDE